MPLPLAAIGLGTFAAGALSSVFGKDTDYPSVFGNIQIKNGVAQQVGGVQVLDKGNPEIGNKIVKTAVDQINTAIQGLNLSEGELKNLNTGKITVGLLAGDRPGAVKKGGFYFGDLDGGNQFLSGIKSKNQGIQTLDDMLDGVTEFAFKEAVDIAKPESSRNNRLAKSVINKIEKVGGAEGIAKATSAATGLDIKIPEKFKQKNAWTKLGKAAMFAGAAIGAAGLTTAAAGGAAGVGAAAGTTTASKSAALFGLTKSEMLTLAASGVSAFGSIQEGRSAKREADFRAKTGEEVAGQQADFIEEEAETRADFLEEETGAQAGFIGSQAEAEALVQEQRAIREREIAQMEERDFRREQSRVLAERRAAMGASGVRLDTGSPVLAMGDFVAEAELQAMRIRTSGELTADRLEQQARLIRTSGQTQAELVQRSGEKEAEMLRTSGRRQSRLIRDTSAVESSLLQTAGRSARNRSRFRAGASLLSGASVAFS